MQFINSSIIKCLNCSNFGVYLNPLKIMFKSKYIIIAFFLISLSFIGLKFGLGKCNNVKILNICEDVSSLDVELTMNKKLNVLEFNSSEAISSVLVFDSKGEIISREKPINNSISLNSIKEKELIVSFISNNKLAFKSILF